MTPQHVISQLLESDTKYPKNLNLLKKIILTAYLGRLRINGLPPDNKIALGNYLFDDERIMFDFTRLSDEKKAIFKKWLLNPHQNEKEEIYFSTISVDEYRGYTAEVSLSWWDSIVNWVKKVGIEHWKINDLSLSFNYQLTGIEMCHGEHGILIGFNQFLTPPTSTKYKALNDDQREPLGNTKRVFITDSLVEQLIGIDLKNEQFKSICKGPHPHSVDVTDQEERFHDMYDYRKTHQLIVHKPWFIRAFDWIVSLFISNQQINVKKVLNDNALNLIHETETIKIYQRAKSNKILVVERKPDIEILVTCGCGSRIFAQIGALKALEELKIRPKKFVGTSAGAIMALLCYLGYKSNEITEIFADFKREHIVYFDIDSNGLSDSHSLKTALDYLIAKKLKQITLLHNIPYPEGKITFRTLEHIKQKYPDCGLGYELVVTATNKKLGKTEFFSYIKSPDEEISHVVTASSSIPVLYKPRLINGVPHNDGGVKNNLPTDACFDDKSTFLESEFGNNLKVFAIQLENGTEKNAIDRSMEEVYRENFILNWIYSMLTGVSDPVTGWVKDRKKLKKYSSQSIVIDVGDVSSANFTVEADLRDKMISEGYNCAMDYLKVRYIQDHENNYKNRELMYSSFNSLGDLLAYCCYRKDIYWFEKVHDLIVSSNLPNKTALMKQSIELRGIYFNATSSIEDHNVSKENNQLTFFGNHVIHDDTSMKSGENHKILLSLYPIFLKLAPELVFNPKDKKKLVHARHSLSLHSPLDCIKYFANINGKKHIVFHIFVQYLKELKNNQDEKLYAGFEKIRNLLYSNIELFKKEYYGNWDLSTEQCMQVIDRLLGKNDISLTELKEYQCKNTETKQVGTQELVNDDFKDSCFDWDMIGFTK